MEYIVNTEEDSSDGLT